MMRLPIPTMARLLAVSLLPMLTFAGHWEPRIDIPFTNYYWGLPVLGHESSHSHAHDHSDHCHGESASCANKPVTSGASFALLREVVLLLGTAAIAIGLDGRWWRPRPPALVLPELQPPRYAIA